MTNQKANEYVIQGTVHYQSLYKKQLYKHPDDPTPTKEEVEKEGTYSIFIKNLSEKDTQLCESLGLRTKHKTLPDTSSVRFKSTIKPVVCDSNLNVINTELPIGEGSVVNVCFTPSKRYRGNVGAYIQAVQLIELVEYEKKVDVEKFFDRQSAGFTNSEDIDKTTGTTSVENLTDKF